MDPTTKFSEMVNERQLPYFSLHNQHWQWYLILEHVVNYDEKVVRRVKIESRFKDNGVESTLRDRSESIMEPTAMSIN